MISSQRRGSSGSSATVTRTGEDAQGRGGTPREPSHATPVPQDAARAPHAPPRRGAPPCVEIAPSWRHALLPVDPVHEERAGHRDVGRLQGTGSPTSVGWHHPQKSPARLLHQPGRVGRRGAVRTVWELHDDRRVALALQHDVEVRIALEYVQSVDSTHILIDRNHPLSVEQAKR